MPALSNGILLPDKLELLDCQTNQSLTADICELTREIAKTGIDAAWWTKIRLSREQRRAESDSGWKWVKLLGELRTHFGGNGYGWCVRTPAGECQGAILYQVGGVSALDPDRPTVFCHRLASAPWNRPALTDTPAFRGVGKGLIKLAALHSFRDGFAGRVTVETYPDPPTRRWYEDMGFQPVAGDPDDILEYELAPAEAAVLLSDVLE